MIADDHQVMRRGLATMLQLETDIEVVAEASDGEEAIRIAREIEPDVILMDVSMPRMNGIEATRAIHSELPHVQIIGLSMYDEEDQAAAILNAGAAAYHCKSGSSALLLAAIRNGIW
jgi:two-component system NarL family response regulator